MLLQVVEHNDHSSGNFRKGPDNRAYVLEKRCEKYSFFRENCIRHRLTTGTYCIIPSTFYPNETAEFFLRVVSEKRAHVWSVYAHILEYYKFKYILHYLIMPLEFLK